MAKSSDQLERELELKRQQLHTRVDGLRQRVAGNVRGMRDQTQDELTGYVHKAEATVSDHPWLSLAGGFGGGIALGLTSAGTNSQKPSAADHESAGHGEGLLSR